MRELDIKNQVYVDLLRDSGFKAVYADPQNKHHLINLLNNVLPEGVIVSDIVEYRDREQMQDSVYSKKTVLDLVCRDDQGRVFSVEVQRDADWSMFKRCVYYASQQYHWQLLEAEEYEALAPVYEIAFLKEKIPHDDEAAWDTDHIISQFGFVENRTGEFAPPTIFITFVEMGRFTKSEAECKSYRDRLFHWMKNGGMMKEEPEYTGNDREMQGLVEAARIAGVDFIVNSVDNADRGVVACVAGDLEEAYARGVELCRRVWAAEVPAKADIVIASPGGYPRDFDLHQSQKALGCAEMLCREGGTIILCAEMRDGAGRPGAVLEKADSPQSVIADFGATGYTPQALSKAYMLARALCGFRIRVAGSLVPKERLERMFFVPHATVQEALRSALKEHGEQASVLIVPNASDVLPVILSRKHSE